MTERLIVVVPCYNEARNIPLILKRFSEVASRADIGLLLVDNGSSDDTPAIISEQLPSFSFARSFRVPVNQGYGWGILQGLAQCDSDYLGWTHADMQTDPLDLLRAFEIIEKGGFRPDIYVKGQRRGRPLSDSFFTGGMSIFESLYLGMPLWDINAQPNIFHRSFFDVWQSPPHDFAFDLFVYYQARRSKLDIVRFDVQFPERLHGVSTWNTGLRSKLRFIKRTLEFSVKLRRSLQQQ
ncbi:MAG: glycosyltransferase family 2 protein [Cyanobacteria bacterium REEB67]|nr:glycosyltransferase family 2 protein [Cyanobacteria bacterium REEB67]